MTYTASQISVGQQILGAVKSVAQAVGLSPADTATAEVDAITAGLAESDLANLNYGDHPASMGGQMSSSRGPFQQISAWGPQADRTDVAKSTRMFLQGGQAGQKGLLDVTGWNTQSPWQAVQAVQGSEYSDGSNYQARYQAAADFVKQYAGASAPVDTSAAAPGAVNASYTAQNASAGGSPSIVGQVGGFVTTALFVLAGLGLVVLGTWRVSAPARGAVTNVVQSLPAPV